MLKLYFRSFGSDLSLSDTRLETSDNLQTSVLVSIFTDRQAPAGQELPAGETDRRGWCLDHTLPDTSAGTGDNIGSLLWLLRREKITGAVVALDAALADIRPGTGSVDDAVGS